MQQLNDSEWHSAILIDQYLDQSSSEKLLTTVGTKYKDPQADNMQRVKDLGTLRPKWEPCRRESGKSFLCVYIVASSLVFSWDS